MGFGLDINLDLEPLEDREAAALGLDSSLDFQPIDKRVDASSLTSKPLDEREDAGLQSGRSRPHFRQKSESVIYVLPQAHVPALVFK